MCVYTCIAPQAYVFVDCTCVMYMYTVKVRRGAHLIVSKFIVHK